MIYGKASKSNPRFNEVINKFQEEGFVRMLDNHIIENSNKISMNTNEFVVSVILTWFRSRFNYKDDPDYVNVLVSFYREHSEVYTLERL